MALQGRNGYPPVVDGYAACTRIERASPCFVGSGPRAGRAANRPDALASIVLADHDRVELVGEPLDERLGRWIAGVRETWSQTTFYLFDAEGWR